MYLCAVHSFVCLNSIRCWVFVCWLLCTIRSIWTHAHTPCAATPTLIYLITSSRVFFSCVGYSLFNFLVSFGCRSRSPILILWVHTSKSIGKQKPMFMRFIIFSVVVVVAFCSFVLCRASVSSIQNMDDCFGNSDGHCYVGAAVRPNSRSKHIVHKHARIANSKQKRCYFTNNNQQNK